MREPFTIRDAAATVIVGTFLGYAFVLCILCVGFFADWMHQSAQAYPKGGSLFLGANYYMSPTGSDANNGLSAGAPWLTPNHAVSCGDVIHAAAGTYSNGNFANAKWGTVSNCPSVNGVYFAQLVCDGPSVTSCNTTAVTGEVMRVDKSNWAIRGWTGSSGNQACYAATPSSAANIHHIAFINAVCTGAFLNGFTSYPYSGNSNIGVDYFACVGCIAYNAAQGTSFCYSGGSNYELVAFDNSPGTHIYWAGFFSWNNIDGSPCLSTYTTDGNGYILDDASHSQSGSPISYTQQVAVQQSMFLHNGAAGVQVFQSKDTPFAISNVTIYGNYNDPNHQPGATYNGDLLINQFAFSPTNVIASVNNNLIQSDKATVPTQGQNVYACFVGLTPNNLLDISGNYCFGVGGQNTNVDSSSGFSFGSNTLATPNFVNPVIPGAPNCAGSATTTDCMATTIANFVPQAGGAAGKGYQSPGACAPNALYPVWLKGVVPNGIITKPCGM